MSSQPRRSTRARKPARATVDIYDSDGGDDEQPDTHDESDGSDGSDEYETDTDGGNSDRDEEVIDSDDEARPAKRTKLYESDKEDALESDLEMSHESDAAETDDDAPVEAFKSKSKPRKSKSSLDEDNNPRSFAREPQPYKFSYENPLNFNGKPLKTISEFFEDLADRLKAKFGSDLSNFCTKFGKKPLNVVTFCSGTEAPILAMGLVQKTLEAKYGSDSKFVFNHQASAEIHPAKAGYIEANFSCNVIFRDIVEISLLQKDRVPKPHFLTTMYGGKAQIPEGTDILIAGFACDDFSSLNNVPKALEEKGESGDTFYAIKAYLQLYHPKIVILENVMHAPWTDEKAANWKGKKDQRSIRCHLDEAGYESIYLKMDTKNHYLPHTRNRGYMIGIHRDSLPAGASWTALEKKCRDMIAALEHTATVPVETLLFASDDPRLEVLEQERKTDNKVVKWDRCKIGHHDYCVEHGLGERHPITNWKPDGSKEMPDFHRSMPGMTERVADSLDVAHKRNLVRGVDDRHYNRILELSQNVFRVEDSSRNGVQQCLTPTNIAFTTAQGRRLAGAEAATLQGIDLALVDTSRLSEQLLTDMCGNAMSSTVVGTVIFATLLTFQDIFDLENRQAAPVEQQPSPCSEKGLVKVESNSSDYTPASVTSVQAAAQSTVRLCFCEGRNKTETTLTFLKCRLCGHTACSKCGKNPKHDYEVIKPQHIKGRKIPMKFEEFIKNSVPREIDLSALHSPETESFFAKLSRSIPEGFDQISWNDVINAIDNALRSKVYSRSIRRAESWILTFDSPSAILKLIISGGHVEWQLFANAKDFPLASAAGRYLCQFPIARMVPEGNDIVRGRWGFWLPSKKVFAVTVTSSGPIIPSYTNVAGLTDVVRRFNHQFITIEFDSSFDARYLCEKLEGRYVASPNCGQAFNSMHIQQGREPEKKPIGLFFDHELQTGNPATHNFKFGTDFRRLDWGEYVDAIAEFPASWRQPVIRGIEIEEDSTVRVEGTNIPIEEYVASFTEQVPIISHGRFVTIHDRELVPSGSSFVYHQLPAKFSCLNLTCDTDLAVFMCEGTIDYKISCLLAKNRWTIIDRKVGASFWNEFLWLLEQGLRIHGHSEANPTWHLWSGVIEDCLSCAPKVPALLWFLNRRGKYTPYEHPVQASVWEKEQKSRPSPMKVLFYIDDLGNIAFQVSMNPATLMHRAKARLLSNGSPSNVEMSFRLVTDHGRKKKPVFKPLTLRNNDGVKMAKQPFAKFTLREEQRRVLTWILEKENKGTIFTEEEVVETMVNEIGYRVEGRATRPILCHGGILAQDVGFGKTVIMLALIAEQRAAEAKKPKAPKTLPNIPGAIETNATLILMPSHLVNQWHSEVEKFMPPEFRKKVIVIGSGQALKFAKLTIQAVIDADIVIVAWDNCVKPPYLKMLANLAGLVEPSVNGTGERAFEVWYQAAVARVQSNVDLLRSLDNTDRFVDHLEQQWQGSMDEASSVDVRVPSKHVTGASYVNSDKRSPKNDANSKSKKRKRDVIGEQVEEFHHTISFTDNDWKSMTNAILEMFFFKRLILDELTYRSGWVNSPLKHLKARNLWMLTGTPAKGGHSDIKNLAELLRVYLGVHDFTGLRSDLFTKRTSDLTKAELFMICQEAPSPAWLERRHQLAQLFLDTYCRKDIAKVNHITCNEHICLVDLSASERAIYLELLQFLAATDFILKRGKSAKGDRSDQIQQVIPSSGDGKPALFLRASHFTLLGVQNTDDLCDMIVARRQDEFRASLREFELHLKQTYWLHRQERGCKKFANFRSRVESHKLGDLEVSKALVKLIAKAANKFHQEDWKDFYRKPGTDITKCKNALPEYPEGKNTTHGVSHLTRMAFELRTWITKLNNDIEEIVNQKRALRFFLNILSLQRSTDFICAHCGIANLKAADVEVMGQCGHLLRRECCAENDCPVSGCSAYNRDYQKLAGSDLVQSGSQWCSEHGSKIDAVIKLILWIISVKKEKVLVFAQWTETTDKLEEALIAAKIPFSDLRREQTSSKILQHFQNGTPPKKGAKVSQVLIMNIGDANASGSNLTMANHIIFMQPYYTSGENAQENYEAAMTQAIGRARRWGQEKKVEVYHFLTVNTIDVDYHEARKNVIISRNSDNPSRGTGNDLKDATEWKTQLGTYFAKSMRFDGAMRKIN